jgi:DNA helicase-2/ATP-dependent DNA helicase PcrA
MEKAAHAISQGKKPAGRAAQLLWTSAATPPEFSGRPVDDWRRARDLLTGNTHLAEIQNKARLLRLLKATDSLAWALTDSWDGEHAYPAAVDAVRRALAADALDVGRPNDAPVHVMTMHKSKGKEYDGVVIVEDRHGMPLIADDGDMKQEASDRRLVRVAITRARHLVVIMRPPGRRPLIG